MDFRALRNSETKIVGNSFVSPVRAFHIQFWFKLKINLSMFQSVEFNTFYAAVGDACTLFAHTAYSLWSTKTKNTAYFHAAETLWFLAIFLIRSCAMLYHHQATEGNKQTIPEHVLTTLLCWLDTASYLFLHRTHTPKTDNVESVKFALLMQGVFSWYVPA